MEFLVAYVLREWRTAWQYVVHFGSGSGCLLLSAATRFGQAGLAGTIISYGNDYIAAPLWMLLLLHELFKFSGTESTRIRYGMLKGSRLHLDCYPSGKHGYRARYRAAILLGLHLQMVALEIHAGGEVSVQPFK